MAIIVLILVLYMAGMLYIGFRGTNKNQSMKDFLTAGRQGGLFIMVCAYIGSHVGNGIVVGGAQYGYTYGIGGVWYGLGACISYILFALIMTKTIYRRGYITVPDMIDDRYNSKATSAIMAALNISCSLGITASQFMAGAALFGALGLNPTLGVVLLSVVVILYCGFAGMKGVIMTDSVQTIVILFSTIFCIIFIGMQGGFQLMSDLLPQSSFEFIPFDNETFIMMLVPAALNGLISSASFQRTASCKSEKVAMMAPIISAVAMIPFVVIPVLIGMYGHALYPEGDGSTILFDVLLNHMNPVIAGLMIAAVLAAVMSTVDIGLLNISANVVNDIYVRIINPKADEKKLGQLTSITTLVIGALALFISLQFNSIISLLGQTYAMVNAGALVMILGAVFWKKGTKEGAIASAICGIGTILLSKFGVPIPFISITALIPALIAYVVVSLVTQKK